jgi:hypothetical protein
VIDGLEAFDWTAGDALGRRVVGDEMGVLLLEALELVQQPIELLVRDLGLVLNVVTLFVIPNGVTQRPDALFRISLDQRAS